MMGTTIKNKREIVFTIITAPWLWVPPAIFTCLTLTIFLFRNNTEWFLYVNAMTSHIPHTFWTHITNLGDTLLVSLILFPFIRKRPDIFWALVFAGLYAILINRGLKVLTDIDRPPAVLSHDIFTIIGPAYRSQSFPSGHTVTVTTIGTLFLYGVDRQWIKWVSFICILVVGLSRIALGVHWPLDVSAGFVFGWIGSMCGLCTAAFLKLSSTNFTKHLWAGIFMMGGLFGLFFYQTPYINTVLIQRVWIAIWLGYGFSEYYRAGLLLK